MSRRKIDETGIYEVDRGDEVIPVHRVKKIPRIQGVRKIKRIPTLHRRKQRTRRYRAR